jgi:cysteine desulfurase/selenocysteine lyase
MPLEKQLQPNTRLIVTTHASNVTGTILPIQDIGKIARNHGIPYLVDASQTAGVLPIDLSKLPVDMMAFPGHKGLLGPQGTGGLTSIQM